VIEPRNYRDVGAFVVLWDAKRRRDSLRQNVLMSRDPFYRRAKGAGLEEDS
jgi:hypothetical protein